MAEFKTTTLEEVDPNTGEVVSVKRKTERVKTIKQQSYLLLRTTDGMAYLRRLGGNKLHVILCMAFYAFIWDNTVNTSPAFWDEVSALIGIKKRQVYRLLREMELDLFIVKMWGGKYMINPDVIIVGGSKYYDQNVKRFQKAIQWRAQGKNTKETYLDAEFRLYNGRINPNQVEVANGEKE